MEKTIKNYNDNYKDSLVDYYFVGNIFGAISIYSLKELKENEFEEERQRKIEEEKKDKNKQEYKTNFDSEIVGNEEIKQLKEGINYNHKQIRLYNKMFGDVDLILNLKNSINNSLVDYYFVGNVFGSISIYSLFKLCDDDIEE